MCPAASKGPSIASRRTASGPFTRGAWVSPPALLLTRRRTSTLETAVAPFLRSTATKRYSCSRRSSPAWPPTTWPSDPNATFTLPVPRPRASTTFSASRRPANSLVLPRARPPAGPGLRRSRESLRRGQRRRTARGCASVSRRQAGTGHFRIRHRGAGLHRPPLTRPDHQHFFDRIAVEGRGQTLTAVTGFGIRDSGFGQEPRA